MTNALNLLEIDQEQCLNLSRFFLKAGKNILTLGRRGTGKTEIAIQAALECNYYVNYINLSVIERPDLLGYPIMDNSDVIRYKSPYFLPLLKEGKKANSIILFDEIDKCPHEITAPLLEILKDRTINGKPVNAVACILTGNLPNEGAYSNEISSALLDRGAKYVLRFSFDKWLIWARANNVHDLILGFLVANPAFACGEIETDELASPSPRGWTYASEALIKAKSMKLVDIETITNIVSGFVGFEAGLQFSIWYRFYRNFEPVILALLESGSCSIDYDGLTPTEKMVFTITACNLAKDRFLRESKSKPQYRCIERLCSFLVSRNVSLENQAIGLSNSFPVELVADPRYKLYQCPAFFELSSRMSLK
jgi:AAA domain (dynein-related subfamily)